MKIQCQKLSNRQKIQLNLNIQKEGKVKEEEDQKAGRRYNIKINPKRNKLQQNHLKLNQKWMRQLLNNYKRLVQILKRKKQIVKQRKK